MPEQEQENQSAASAAPTKANAAAASATVTASAPAAPARKAFDVAIVDPQDPSILHWPRMRVMIDAATAADLPNIPPPAGETVPQEKTRIEFALKEIERARAIAAYNGLYGLNDTHLRYDVIEADPASTAPVEPAEWAKFRREVGLA